jgi:hypothetical protein
MDEAHQSAEWDRTANLMCIVANAVRGKRRPFKPHEFHPFAESPRSSSWNRISGFFNAVRAQRKSHGGEIGSN